MSEDIQVQAIQAIGKQAPDDWLLAPEDHAGTLPAEAGPLQRILESTALDAVMRRFRHADEDAGRHQAEFKRFGRAEAWLTAVAAILGALVLWASSALAQEPGWEKFAGVAATVLVVLQAVAVGGAALSKFRLKSGGPFEKWMLWRTEAESARIDFFEAVCGLRQTAVPQTVEPGELPLLPLQLEYFRRYQLEVQINYYRGRGRQHEEAASRLLGFGGAVAFIGALLATLAAGVAKVGSPVEVLAALGVITPALMAAHNSLANLGQDERNAVRYRTTLLHLLRRLEELDAARRDALRGDRERVHEFIRRANSVISVEHSQWSEELHAGEKRRSEAGQGDGQAGGSAGGGSEAPREAGA